MIWSFGRAVIWIKRLALAAERIAEAQESQSRLAYQSFNLAHPERRAPKPAEFGVADVGEDWNKHWLEQHPEEAQD